MTTSDYTEQQDEVLVIDRLKQIAGANGFVSVLGKSTIASDSVEYQFIVDATRYVLGQGFGVIHGGYAGGAMSAANDTACAYIQEKGLCAEWNIGVPQLQHDGLWERVTGAVFTEPSNDIFDRLRLVTGGDIAVVAPLGGEGTELEVTALLHENLLRRSQASTYAGVFPTPVIFLQTSNGVNWKSLLQEKMRHLTTSTKALEQCPWILFAHSTEEFSRAFAHALTMLDAHKKTTQ